MTTIQRRLIRWGLVLLSGVVSRCGFAGEDGVDIFLKALLQTRIDSGTVSYDMSKNAGEKTEEEIQAECEERIKQFKKSFPNDPDTDKIVSMIPDSVRAQYTQKKIFSGLCRFDFSQKGYRYVKNQVIYDDDSEKPVTVIDKRVINRTSPSIESAMLDPSISQVIVNNTISNVADFSQFGRVRGVLAFLMNAVIEEKGEGIAKEEIKKQTRAIAGDSKDVTVLEVTETKPFDGGPTSYTLESKVDGQVTQRYTVVPSLGYVCPDIELYDSSTGNLTEKYEASDFVQQPRTGIYYPTNYTESRYDNTTGKLIERREYKINQESLSLNEPMSPKDFSLDVPEGLRVLDSRYEKNVEYYSIEAGTLSLEEGGFDLEKMPWLSKVGELAPKDFSIFQQIRLAPRIALIAIGLCIIVWSFVRRRRRKTSAV